MMKGKLEGMRARDGVMPYWEGMFGTACSLRETWDEEVRSKVVDIRDFEPEDDNPEKIDTLFRLGWDNFQ